MRKPTEVVLMLRVRAWVGDVYGERQAETVVTVSAVEVGSHK